MRISRDFNQLIYIYILKSPANSFLVPPTNSIHIERHFRWGSHGSWRMLLDFHLCCEALMLNLAEQYIVTTKNMWIESRELSQNISIQIPRIPIKSYGVYHDLAHWTIEHRKNRGFGVSLNILVGGTSIPELCRWLRSTSAGQVTGCDTVDLRSGGPRGRSPRNCF